MSSRVDRPQSGLDVWLAELERSGLPRVNIPVGAAEMIAALQRQLRDPIARIAIGGHFSSGKSSLLNAALGRGLLPVDDLPETGAICAISSGARDYAEVRRGAERIPIDCTTAAIQHEVSLFSASTGKANTRVKSVDTLNITLANVPIPPNVCWIDSPGTDDTSEMSARALAAARQADILLWVLTSKQLLGEGEVKFLTQYVAECGSSGLIFVINAFLQDDTVESWRRFLERDLLAHRTKIHERWPMINDQLQSMGLPMAEVPEIVTVSARAVGNGAHNGFGGPELRGLLHRLSGAHAPDIQRSRLQRGAMALHMLVPTLEADLHRAGERLAQQAAEIEGLRVQAERNWQAFGRATRAAVDKFMNAWNVTAFPAGLELTDSIARETLRYDQGYATALHERLKAVAGQLAGMLVQDVNAASQQWYQHQLSSQAAHNVYLGLEPPLYPVNVQPPSGGGTVGLCTVIGVVAGTVVLAFLPILGTIIGGALGYALGKTIADSTGLPQAVESAKASTRYALGQAVDFIAAKRESCTDYILQQCSRPWQAPPVDRSHHQALGAQLQIVRLLVGRAVELSPRAPGEH